MTNPEIPYFIRMRGCINCDASKRRKEKTGKEYGFDHGLMFRCVALCGNYNFDLSKPYLDPAEVVRLANKDGSPKVKSLAREYCLGLEHRFGEFYKQLGISVEEIIKELE